MDMAQYYTICPTEIDKLSTRKLSIMYSAMVSNRAEARIKRLEELSMPYMKEDAKDKFINSIFKQIDDGYKSPQMVNEDDLKRIFNNAGR